MTLFKSYGKLCYDKSEFRLTLKVSQDISDYYRTLIPQYLRVYRQGWAAHITVVRPNVDVVSNYEMWNRHTDEIIDFEYSPYIENGYGFYWLNGWSKQMEVIRTELGLQNISRFPLIPHGYDKTFHCTIGRYDAYSTSDESPEK